MTDTPDSPQSVHQVNQIYLINVQKMYKHYITGSSTPGDNEQGEIIGIDDVRGEISVSVTGTTTANLINSLHISPTSTTPAPTPNTSTPVRFAQESRCHAFYRIIGLPVVSADGKSFYNPGLDVIKVSGVGRQITLDKKIQIANSVGADFEKLSQSRETYVGGVAQIFSVPDSIEAGVLALTSGTYGKKGVPNIRKFNIPFSNNPDAANKPLDLKNGIAEQAYTTPGSIISNVTLWGENEVFLADFQDANGAKPNVSVGGYKIMSQHEHIIRPFMVDPRIDFSVGASRSKTVSGVSKRVAVPFVPDSSYLTAGSTSFADTPLLEKIITQRAKQFKSTTDAGQAAQQQIDFLKKIKTIVNPGTSSPSKPFSAIFSDQIFQISQQDMFNKYVSKMQSLVDALVDQMQFIHGIQGLWYWLPKPDQRGPEGGCTVRNLPITEGFNTDFYTTLDKDVVANQIQFFIANITSSAAQANAIPDLAGTGKTIPVFTFDSNTSDSEGDTTSDTMKTLTQRRTSELTDAGRALQVVEMIMGEFSGLGLCDIVVIVGALWTMPFADLLGFLDVDAFSRAQKLLPNGQSIPTQTTAGHNIGTGDGVQDSLQTLSIYVTGFYQIMDGMLAQSFGQNGSGA
jgi:hypothetical protein